MKIRYQKIIIDNKTRVVRKIFYLPSLFGACYVLQRKKQGFFKTYWRNVSWCYCNILEDAYNNPKDIIYWLKWSETETI